MAQKPEYTVHLVDSPAGQAALASRGLTTRDLARAVAEFQKQENVRVGTLIGVNQDGFFGSTREGWRPDQPDALAEPLVNIPWVQLLELLGQGAGRHGGRVPDIVRAYADGAVIRSKHGFFLAIPTPAAGKYGDGKQKMNPGLWERLHGARLKFVYRRRGPSLLVAESLRARSGKRGGFAKAGASALRTGRGLATVPMFILVPQVTIKKRLDVDGAASKWLAALPGLVVRNWRETVNNGA